MPNLLSAEEGNCEALSFSLDQETALTASIITYVINVRAWSLKDPWKNYHAP